MRSSNGLDSLSSFSCASFSASSSSFLGQVYALLGMENIADEADPDGFGFPQLASEYVVSSDPDLIFLADSSMGVTPDSLAERPGWAEMTAVQGGAVAILDEYLSNIRQVEQQLDRMETRLSTITGTPEAPLGLPEAFDDHMTVTYDLMHLAFQGDISRVFTFMIGHEASDRGYAHIGIPETHHSISHHGNDAEKLAKYAKIGTYQIIKFGEFLDKLKATPDGDGNLLDNSLLYWGSGMSNGNAHDRSNPPAVLVGGAHGRLKGNRHVEAKKDEPTANLLLAMAHLAGTEIESLGASTGRLDL